MNGPLIPTSRRAVRLLPVLFVLLLALPAFSNTVTFDTEPLGTIYGAPSGHVPGDLIFSEDLADVYVDDFFVAGNPYFNRASIDAPFLGFGSVHILGVNNIGIVTDFNAAGDASFEFLDLGGTVNIQVNGFGVVIEAPDFPSLGTFNPAPGVTMSTTWVSVGGGISGTVTLTGPVQTLRIGGQELWIDNLDCNNGLGGGGGGGGCDFEVTYDPLTIGTRYGNGYGQSPGDWVFTEDGIPVFVEMFDAGTINLFNFMEVQGAFAPIGSGNLMSVNNINQRFDIAALGTAVSQVTFEFLDQGGTENLQVNGATMYVGDLEFAPAAIAPGVTFVVSTSVTGLGLYGQVTLIGDVQELVVGGQEFFIDNICVEKAAPCDKLVHHESQPVGALWGNPVATPPGTLMFTEDGIPVSIGQYQALSGGWFYNYCEIQNTFLGFGDAHIMNINNVTNHYDIAASGITSNQVTFEYLDLGGEENLMVNGALYYVGDLHLAPAAIAPGVIMSVVTAPLGGGIYGQVTLTGQVDQLVVGGQEFWIDNICVMGNSTGPVLWCDHLSDIETRTVGEVWGGLYGDLHGDFIFAEDGMDAHIFSFMDPTGIFVLGEARVDPAFPSFGSGNILTLNNISAGYDLSGLGPIEEVRFEYFDGAGIENLQVNGSTLYVGELKLAPTAIAPGVTCTVYDTPDAGFSTGTVVLEGNVQTFRVGGQQFAIDNVCARLAGSTTDASPLPAARTQLLPNYPNPFNPSTTLSFSLGRESNVRLTIHDVAGRAVRTLVDGSRDAGEHSVLWDGKDEKGGNVATGVYFVRVESRDGVDTQKIALIK